MYLSHYKLAQKPFQISPNPEFLWLGEKHKEALAMMEYGILNNQGFLVLTGDVGTGKTTLINALVNKLGEDILVATIFNPRLDKLEFFHDLAAKFNIERNFTTKIDFLNRFGAFLYKAYRDNKRVLLIIDEAQNLFNELLEEIRLLSNIETQQRKLLNIFFVGQNEFNHILMKKECRPLRQRITITSNIKPLTEAETREYIAHRLKIAGCERELFTDRATREIHAFSKGYPRLINVICDQALLTAYVNEMNAVKPLTIRECVRELQLPDEVEDHSPKKITAVPSKQKFTFRRAVLYTLLLGVVTLNGYFLTSASYGQYISNLRTYYGPLLGKMEIFSLTKSFERKEIHRSISAEARTLPKEGFAEKIKQVPSLAKNEEGHLESQRVSTFHHGVRPSLTESLTKKEIVRPALAKAEALPLRVPGQDSADLSVVGKNTEDPVRSAKSYSSGDSEEVSSLGDLNLIIPFDYNSNEVPPQAYESLNKIAEIMRRQQNIEIRVQGHTDSLGSYEYNQKLSAFRANVVKSYLVGKGINPGRVRAIGVGEENPFASNITAAGRRANRRVTIQVAPHES